jgi:hypothetical protein
MVGDDIVRNGSDCCTSLFPIFFTGPVFCKMGTRKNVRCIVKVDPVLPYVLIILCSVPFEVHCVEFALVASILSPR